MEEPIDIRCLFFYCPICHHHPKSFHIFPAVIPSDFMKKSQILWKKVKGHWGSHNKMQLYKGAHQISPELLAREGAQELELELEQDLVLHIELVSTLSLCKQLGLVSDQVQDLASPFLKLLGHPIPRHHKMIGTKSGVFVLVITLVVMLRPLAIHPCRRDVG